MSPDEIRLRVAESKKKREEEKLLKEKEQK